MRNIIRTVIAVLVAALAIAIAVPAGAQAAARINLGGGPFSSRVLVGGSTEADQTELSGTLSPSGFEFAVRDPVIVEVQFGPNPYVGCDDDDPNYVRCLEVTPAVSGQQIEVQPGGGDDQISLNFPTRNLSGPIYFPDVAVNNTSGADRITSTGASNDQITTVQGTVKAGPGNDIISLVGSTGPASVSGGPGADTIDTRNSFADTISCGPDTDQLQLDALDRADPDCETGPGAPSPAPPGAIKAMLQGALKLGKLPKLAKALKGGVTVSVACTKPASARAVLTIDKKLAKRLGLKRKVASASATCGLAAKKVKLRFSSKAKRGLASRRTLQLSLVVTLAGGSQAKKTVRLKA